MENLSEFYIQKAKVELREDEIRKQQSIKQVLEWLEKHPFIKKCDVETFQVLQFLRAKKYNMDKVYESFNKIMIFIKMHPQVFDYTNLTQLLEIYDKGPFLVINQRDAEGRRIIILRHKILEDSIKDFNDLVKLNTLVSDAIISESETQISGVIYIHDFRSISIKYISKIDMELMMKFSSLITFMALRVKQINIVGLPSIANSIIEMITSFMSEKIKNRVNFLRNCEDLKNVLDVTILPVEYGGTADVGELLVNFRMQIETTGRRSVKFIKSIQIDEKMMKKYDNEKVNETIGCFRKLEID